MALARPAPAGRTHAGLAARAALRHGAGAAAALRGDLAADTVNRAAQARGAGDPRAIAQAAASAAARQFAPGLLGRAGSQVATQGGSGAGVGGGMTQGGGRGQGQGAMRQSSGRWARQGHKIVLYGV